MRRQSLPFGVLQRIPAAALFLLAPQDPEWRTTPPFDAILKGDMKAVAASGERA